MGELTNETKSNVGLGLIGALLGALIGAVLWVVFYQIGIIAYIAGIAIIVLACKGYALFSKHLDVKGVVICIVMAIVMLLAAHTLCWGLEIYYAFSADYDITLFDSILSIPDVIVETDLVFDFFKELLIGVILLFVGGIPYVKKVLHEKKAAVSDGMSM